MTRILVVDDEATVRDGLLAYLSSATNTVEAASNLEEAVGRISEQPFDLVLSDVRMTQPSGSEGLVLLREYRKTGRGRFALMTGYASAELRGAALDGGVDAFFPKPLDLAALDRLVDEIASSLEVRRAPRAVSHGDAAVARRLSDAAATELLASYAASHDENAFQQLVLAFTPLVYSIPLKWYRLSREDAEDVFQEVMVQLVIKAAEIRNVRLWMIGTAVNCSRQRIGGRERQRRIAESWRVDATRLPAVEIETEHDVRDLVRYAVSQLSEKERNLVHALYYDELSYKEIAQRFGMPEGSIGPTRGRILRALGPLVAAQESRPTEPVPTMH